MKAEGVGKGPLRSTRSTESGSYDYEAYLKTLPEAKAWIQRDAWGKATQLLIWCPICEDIHSHGASPAMKETDDHWGMRVAHCLTGPGGSYLLVPAKPGEVLPKRPSYQERLARLLADDKKRGISYRGTFR